MSRAITVAVDATPLVGDRTGVGVSVTGMVTELAGRPGLSLVGYGLTARGWKSVREALPAGVSAARGPMPAGPLLRAWAASELPPVEWWSGRADVVHGTNFVVPPTRAAKRIVSVWDLTAVRYPEMCTPTALRYPGLIRRALSRGAWVHTGAHVIAAEIVEYFDVDPDRVRVIAPGIDLVTLPGSDRRPTDARPYLLALGATEPRKDISGLVEAFGLVAPTHPDLELKIAGPPGWAEAEVTAAIRRSAYGSRIHRLGWVPDVRSLLAGAALFAYPSVYEGFGLPPLEAMSLGVPVVATAAGAVPEVVGPAAELVAAGDPVALAAAIDHVLSVPATRDRLIEAGRHRVAEFSWKRAGDALEVLYRDVAGA